MDKKLKYRLVGATLILAIMVFFLPLVLDSEKYHSKISSQIPSMPAASGDSKDRKNTSNTSTALTKSGLEIESDAAKKAAKDTAKGTLVIDLEQAEFDSNKSINIGPDEKKQSKKTVKADTKSVNPNKIAEVKASAKLADINQDTAKKTTAKPSVKIKKEPNKEKLKVSQTAQPPSFKEKAYVIQIGSFSNKDNAKKLVEQLRSKDYRAYQRIDEKFARVYVGPYPDKDVAVNRQKALASLVGNKVSVIEFNPKAH